MTVLVITGFAVAVMAAVRSTWSPCGLSMLSSITPIGERGRGNRFGRTAAWFIVGSVLGGLTLGTAAGALAMAWTALGVSSGAVLFLGAVGAALAVLGDLGLLRFQIPLLRRQVNERWLDQFRGVVYGIGFGWQIGVGVATYIMTTGVLLLIGLAVLDGHLLVAVAFGATFGTVRGVAVLAGARATTPERLRHLHRQMDRAGAPVRRATIVALAMAALALGADWWLPSLLVAVPAVLGLGVVRLWSALGGARVALAGLRQGRPVRRAGG
jgi:hypothetical protein